MLKYVLLSYLCLFVGVQCNLSEPDEFMKSYLSSPVPLPENYLIAPEGAFDKKSFAVLHYKKLKTDQLQLEAELYIISELSVEDSRKCVVNLRARYGSDRVGISELHRLYKDKLVLTWYDDKIQKTSLDRRYNIKVINMFDHCKQLVNMEGFKDIPIVIPSRKVQVLDILVNDIRYCSPRTKTQCRLFFNFAHSTAYLPYDLNIKFNWTSIQVQRLQDRDILIYGQKGNTFKASRLDMISNDGEKTFLKVIGSPNMEVIASGLSVCWNVHPGSSFQVKCVQFNQRQDNFLLNQNINNLYEEVQLLDVHAISRGKVLLIVKKVFCEDEEDCWKLKMIKVQQEQDNPETTELSFPCTGDQKKLVVFSSLLNDVTNKTDVHYVCRNNNGYTFSYLEL